MIKNSKYEVLTSEGFKDFDGLNKTVNNMSIIFTFTDNTTFHCTRKHKFDCNGDTVIAEDLRVNDELSDKKISNIEEIVEQNFFYDLINVKDGHHYTCSGIENKNCAFIRHTLWDEFSDSVFPAQDALAEKQTIISSTPNGLNHYFNLVEGARKRVNGYNIVDCHWTEVPRWNKDGTLKDPEVFKKEQIAKNGVIFWNQNFGCVGYDTLIDIESQGLIKIGELYDSL